MTTSIHTNKIKQLSHLVGMATATTEMQARHQQQRQQSQQLALIPSKALEDKVVNIIDVVVGGDDGDKVSNVDHILPAWDDMSIATLDTSNERVV